MPEITLTIEESTEIKLKREALAQAEMDLKQVELEANRLVELHNLKAGLAKSNLELAQARNDLSFAQLSTKYGFDMLHDQFAFNDDGRVVIKLSEEKQETPVA